MGILSFAYGLVGLGGTQGSLEKLGTMCRGLGVYRAQDLGEVGPSSYLLRPQKPQEEHADAGQHALLPALPTQQHGGVHHDGRLSGASAEDFKFRVKGLPYKPYTLMKPYKP